MGRGSGGQVVSVLTFNSDDSSSNPAEVYSFSVKFVFEKNGCEKEAGFSSSFSSVYQDKNEAIFTSK